MRYSQFARSLVLSGLLGFLVNAQSAQLSIERGPSPIKLGIAGSVGSSYILEQSSNPGAPDSWSFLLGLTLAKSSQPWVDSSSILAPQRFYRLRPQPQPPAETWVNNFRLIDYSGVSRELYYYANQPAIVLIFADANSSESEGRAAEIKSLKDQFGPSGVVFWLIDANADAGRLAPLSALKLDVPILQDRGQLVAKAFGAAVSPEAVCINTIDWTIFYRGAINDRATPSSAPAQNYLADALSSFLAGQTVAIHRTQPAGRSIELPHPSVSYAHDVAPLLEKSCVRCHSPGNIAPWAMTNYATVRDYSSSIKAHLLAGSMPPWHADPQHGVFANDISLKPEQAGLLLQWVADGSPRGDGPDPLADLYAGTPPPANYPYAWPTELGKPDYIVTIPKQSIPARGEVAYKYPQVVANIPSNVWLRAAVVLPGNTRAVHHALVFAGNLLEVFVNGGGLNGFFAGYVPGANAVSFPEGTGKFLKANSPLTFQMHYTTTGQAETDQTQLGLYFMSKPPALQLQTGAANNISITIPPGDSEYEREAWVTPSTTNDVLLYEMSPHMHYRGSRFKFEALYPDGTTEVLLSVPKYDFHWQTLYRLAQPKRLRAGTIIRCTGAFDNSAQNHHNPDPNATVTFGEQTDDEMFIGYLNFSIIP
jgi:hypothetical protein